MASRLDLMWELGLPDPGSIRMIGKASEDNFLAWVSEATGREVSGAEFKAWVGGEVAGEPQGSRVWGNA